MKGWLEIVLFSVEWQRTKREFISYVSTQNIISVTRGLWVSLITLVNLTRKGNCGTQIFYRILTNPLFIYHASFKHSHYMMLSIYVPVLGSETWIGVLLITSASVDIWYFILLYLLTSLYTLNQEPYRLISPSSFSFSFTQQVLI